MKNVQDKRRNLTFQKYKKAKKQVYFSNKFYFIFEMKTVDKSIYDIEMYLKALVWVLIVQIYLEQLIAIVSIIKFFSFVLRKYKNFLLFHNYEKKNFFERPYVFRMRPCF